MKKILAFLTAFAMLFAIPAVFAQENAEIKIYVDGTRIDIEKAPVIENSRTLAPIRAVAEAAGISILWNGQKNQVLLSYDYTTVTLTIGSNKMDIYNSIIDKSFPIELEAQPKIIDSSTYVTLRAALEALGATVEWDGESDSIYVTSPSKKVQNSVKDNTENNTNSEFDSTASDNVQPDNSQNSETDEKITATFEYTGFRTMENDKISQNSPHALYGRIKTTLPITYVRCRIVGTEMDAMLRFNAEDNLKNYNVNTYFDKLMCFSDAAIGENTFEVYAAVNNENPQLIFSYTYTVFEENEITEENSKEIADVTPPNSSANNDANADEAAISFYGFYKMADDKIILGAPHGLYGNVVSNRPIIGVRCRILDTDMDYSVEILPEDNIKNYNVFTYFDKLICFSDAGVGKHTFEIYATCVENTEKLLFSYSYTVTDGLENTFSSENTDNIFDTDSKSEVVLPLEGEIKVTSPYGFRAYNKWEFHKGVDIVSDSTNILAVADGTVVDCATGRNSGVGNYVALQHDGGWVSLYYHLNSYDVEIGDTVLKGEKFAVMGNSGGNYGVHLHFMTCDKWYGSLWATQNNHHTAPHEYVPQLLTDVLYYNPNFEKDNTDKMILCTFAFPTVITQGSPISISSSGAFVASENPLSNIKLTVTDSNGNTVLQEITENPAYYTSDDYTYTNISAKFDMQCEFNILPIGEYTVAVTAKSITERERIVYEKKFEVIPTVNENQHN